MDALQINLKPEHIEQLNKLAEESGRGTDDMIAEAVHNYLENEAWLRAEEQKSPDETDLGPLLTTEEVRARIDRILKKH